MPSTAIRSFHYEPETSRLVVQFQSGRRYAYFGVPPDVYGAMRAAHSRGAYFNAWIRDRYSYSRLADEEGGAQAARQHGTKSGNLLSLLLRPTRWGQH